MDVQAIATLATKIPIDAVIALVLIGGIMFDAYRSGTGRATTLAISLPLSVAFFGMLTDTIGFSTVSHFLENPLMQLGAFIVLFALFFFLIYRMLSASFGLPSPIGLALLAGIAVTIVFFVTCIQLPALAALLHLSAPVQTIFGASYRLLWFIGAYVTLAFVRS